MMRCPLVVCGCLLAARVALPCSIVVDASHPQATAHSIVRDADAIVIATAVRTLTLPDREQAVGRRPGDNFEALLHGTVELRVQETIKGDAGAASLRVEGRLVDADEFNPQPVPYGSVRPTGLRGACFTYDYRAGGRYLLLLKRSRTGALTPYWAPLQPVNEQLHDGADPWVLWVRDQVAAK